ncbi:MAG: response regulator [Candidatus Promineifilaceae bacterium]|nr:response regulator [Candidatus Promineifilaceae bacterium]
MIDAEPKKLFIVEDDVDLAEMLTAYFSSQGYEIESAELGERAITKINEQLPDLILLDVRLPDIDGYEVCRRLRSSRRTRHLPVIFLTERREREDRLAGLKLGAVDYITKPFDIQELRLRVRNALRRRGMQSLHNPVTGLPEGPLVQEQLEETLEEGGWGLVLVEMEGLSDFRDQYGFVAADDVARAVSLMLTNAMQTNGGTETFIGHPGQDAFLIITDEADAHTLAERCRLRLEPSVQYFYPAAARGEIASIPAAEQLNIRVGALTSADGSYGNLRDLGAALNRLFD